MSDISFVHWLVIISIFIQSYGIFFYVRDTLLGKNKPNRITWFFWAFAPLVGTAAAIDTNADFWAASRIFLAGFFPLLVFLASFVNSNSYFKLSLFDFICGFLSFSALCMWLISDAARTAILFSAIGDGFASLPTIKKCWQEPQTETKIAYLTSLISTLLVIPSIKVWNIENSAFQIYLLALNIILVFCVYRKNLKALSTPKSS